MRSLVLVALVLTACSGELGRDPGAAAAPPEPAAAGPGEIATTKGEPEDQEPGGPTKEKAEAAPGLACAPLDTCAAPALAFERRAFQSATSSVIAMLGQPHHRVRDMLFTPGEPQRIHAKFTYSTSDKDLHGETIVLFVQRDCASGWTPLGEATTTEDGEHPTVDGVEDNGGRIYFDVPEGKELGLGRHRVRAVVAGDGTFADGFIDVVPKDTRVVVSDVDGTLTSSELIEAAGFLTDTIPETHAGAPEAFQALAAKGYRFMYLTARPELLTERTRAFLARRGFPPGIVHTATASTGALASADAAKLKSGELALLKSKGLVASFGFGNKTSDSDAYVSAVSDEQHRIFFQIDGDFSGRRIDSYEELVPDFEKLDSVCN